MDILKAWSIQLGSVQGKHMVDWLDEHSVNGDAWDEFRIGDHGNPNVSTSSFLPPLSPYSSSDTRSEQRQPRPPVSAAAEFRKGIKRDKSHYKEIKNEKQWDDWKRSTISTVYAHGCENILSQSHVPATPDDTILFNEQQKFMYDVWVNVLRTPMGKHYVRKNEGQRDAQAVWRDYANYLRSSYNSGESEAALATVSGLTKLVGGVLPTNASWLQSLHSFSSLIVSLFATTSFIHSALCLIF